MANINCVVLAGNITGDIELKKTPDGKAVTTFTVAVNRRYAKGESKADFINVVAWEKKAEFVSQYFGKGKNIVIEGRIQTRSYEEKDGHKRTATEVVAEEVSFGDNRKEEKDEAPAFVPDKPEMTEVDDSDLPF